MRDGGGAPLGEIFAFISGLYFRGKLTYAEYFARPPAGLPGILVVTAGGGLMEPHTVIGAREMAAFAEVPIDLREPRYREPLEADISRLASRLGEDARVVLLGSIATSKYVELLVERLGDRVHFPAAFVGTGDMQRGAMLLRAVKAGEELPYVRASGALRSRSGSGPRPAR